MQVVEQLPLKTAIIKKKSIPRRTSKSNHSRNIQDSICRFKPETVIVNQLQRPQSTSVVTLQFKQFQPLRKYSLNKTTKRINAYTIQEASKKMVNIYKENNKTRYHELFKQTADQFFKNTIQLGPQVKSILKQNDTFDQRKLINIQKIGLPLRHLKQNSGIRHKTSYKSNYCQIKQSESDEDHHKRTKSFLDANNFILNNHSFSDRSRVRTCKKKLTSGLQSLIPIRKPNNRKDYFVFGMGDRTCTAQNKIQMYRDLLWKVNYSNSLYVMTPQTINNSNNSYKVYVGPGNNSNLIKGIVKRRFWWTITTNRNQQGIHFMWTQLKYNNFYKDQESIALQYSKKADQFLIQNTNENEQNNIFSHQDLKNWKQHFKKNQKTQKEIGENTYKKRVKLYEKKKVSRIQDSNNLKMHNHLQNNFYIGNKKALFYNVKRYMQLQLKNPFSFIPLTFHIKKGLQDPQWKHFLQYYQKFENQKNNNSRDTTRNVWIVKPGQNTNRGNGITVCFNLDDIYIRLKGKQRNRDGKLRTFILQKYIQNPMLYQKRKFDIRHYALITCVNGGIKAYWYQQGYIRTSSSQFSLKANRDPLIHLTNDAVQKNTPDYGKYEKGNKLSYQQFQKYLQTTYPQKKYNFFTDILPKIKEYATQAFRSTYSLLDQKRRANNFQLLGLDFMIDEQFNPWLIQVNTNPCLQLSSPLLAKIIPSLIQNTMRLTIDPLFPPPESWPSNKKTFFGEDPMGQNKFSLVFDERIQGKAVQKIYKGQNKIDSNMGKIQQEDQIFQDQGVQNWEQKNV